MLKALGVTHFVLLVSFFHLQFLCSAQRSETLTQGQSITTNETLVSATGLFSLGFFSPSSNSSHRYLGIWYTDDNPAVVVWVANRANPLQLNLTPSLILTNQGKLSLFDAETTNVLWSPTTPAGTTVMLLDSGNLVLRDEGGAVLWQSFNYPTNTFLPNMFLRSKPSGKEVVAWRSADDPSPGSFSFGIDPVTSLQIFVWNGTQPHWRSHVWNGKSLGGARESNNSNAQYVLKISLKDGQISISFTPSNEASPPARYVLDHKGVLAMLVRIQTGVNHSWIPFWTRPSRFCDPYNRCGPSGACDNGSGGPPFCKCFQGFVPKNQKDWDQGDYSGGCMRRVPLKCDMEDGFLKSERMKLPDRFVQFQNLSEESCKSECLRSCPCTAYSFTDVTDDYGKSRTRCLVWVGDLLDMEQVANGGEDLHIRLVASELSGTNNFKETTSNTNKHFLHILLPTLSAVMLLFGILVYFVMKRSRRQRPRGNIEAVLLENLNLCRDNTSGKTNSELPLVDYNSILAATNNFSMQNILGEGGFGPVYKGTLPNGQLIAVKRLAVSSGQGFHEFKNEVELIGELQHTNLVQLHGWCVHENENILIYEYLPNKSLDKFVFDPTLSVILSWSQRYHIIDGIAQGLLYLHKYSRLRVIHRDLKASNILLDARMSPKISDFGLARVFGGNQTEANTNRIVGTYGYMSPEYALHGLFSEKSDVFSFGVLILEIVTGKKSTGYYPYQGSLNLLGYAWQLWGEGRIHDLVDASISANMVAAEVSKCVHVGLLCIQENVDDRPTMSLVISMLGNERIVLVRPKQPAFAVGGHVDPTKVNSSSTVSQETLNGLTLSVVEGR